MKIERKHKTTAAMGVVTARKSRRRKSAQLFCYDSARNKIAQSVECLVECAGRQAGSHKSLHFGRGTWIPLEHFFLFTRDLRQRAERENENWVVDNFEAEPGTRCKTDTGKYVLFSCTFSCVNRIKWNNKLLTFFWGSEWNFL